MPEQAPAGAAHAGPVREFCDAQWETEVLPLVRQHIRVPAVSPAYDPGWEAHGHLDRAVDAAADWLRNVPLPGLRVEVLRAAGRQHRCVWLPSCTSSPAEQRNRTTW